MKSQATHIISSIYNYNTVVVTVCVVILTKMGGEITI